MDITKYLARQAKKNGICKEWHKELLTLADKDALCEMYLRGIDFCLSNDYPNNGFIQSHFKGVMEKHGIFLDDKVSVENTPKCVCLGACSGQITIDGFNVCEVFGKHDSTLTISARGNAFVMVDVFDNSTIIVQAYDRAKVCVNRYGGTIHDCAIDDATIKIREKNKKTY